MLGMISLSGSLACSHSCYMRSSLSQPHLRSRAISRPLCRSAIPTVAAAEASEKRQATKVSEFQGMGADKIDEEVQKSKRALFDLRIAQRTKKVGLVRFRAWLQCLKLMFDMCACSHSSPATSGTTKRR